MTASPTIAGKSDVPPFTAAGVGSAATGYMGLDQPLAEFALHLDEAAAMVLRVVGGIGTRSVGTVQDPADVASQFDQPLPELGIGLGPLLRRLEQQVAPAGLYTSEPGFFAWINSPGNQAAILTSMVLAALSHYSGKWDASAAAAVIERKVLEWLAEFIGYEHFSDGIVTSGGSDSMVLALAAARARHRSERPTTQAEAYSLYCSVEAHSCVDKAARLLDIATIRRIPVDRAFRMDVGAARKCMARDVDDGLSPLAVIATAGTTNTGAVDDVRSLHDLARLHGAWIHVDGAYGAAAARVPLVAGMFDGLALADSVSVNPHKWLNVPVEAGALLLRHDDALRRAFAVHPPYLERVRADEGVYDVHERGIQLSKDLKAVKVWATFLAYGAKALRDAIASNIVLMREFGGWLASHPRWELLAPVSLSAVVFRVVPPGPGTSPEESDAMTRRLAAHVQARGRVFIHTTMVTERVALRACSVNHRLTRDSIDQLVSELEAARCACEATVQGPRARG